MLRKRAHFVKQQTPQCWRYSKSRPSERCYGRFPLQSTKDGQAFLVAQYPALNCVHCQNSQVLRNNKLTQVTQMRALCAGNHTVPTEQNLVQTIRNDVRKSQGARCPEHVIQLARSIDTPSSRILLLGVCVKSGGDTALAETVFEECQRRNEITDTHILGLMRTFIAAGNEQGATDAITRGGGVQNSLTTFAMARREILELCLQKQQSGDSKNSTEAKRTALKLIAELLPVYNASSFYSSSLSPEQNLVKELRKVSKLVGNNVFPLSDKEQAMRRSWSFYEALKIYAARNDHLKEYAAHHNSSLEHEVKWMSALFVANLLVESGHTEWPILAALIEKDLSLEDDVTEETHRSWMTVWGRCCVAASNGTEAISKFSHWMREKSAMIFGFDLVCLASACVNLQDMDAVYSASRFIKQWSEQTAQRVSGALKASAPDVDSMGAGEILFRPVPRHALTLVIEWMIENQSQYMVSTTLSFLKELQTLPQSPRLSAPFYDTVVCAMVRRKDFISLIEFVKSLATNNLKCTSVSIDAVLQERRNELLTEQKAYLSNTPPKSLGTGVETAQLKATETNQLTRLDNDGSGFHLSRDQWSKLFRSMVRLCYDPLSTTDSVIEQRIWFPSRVDAAGQQLPQAHYRYLSSLERTGSETTEESEDIKKSIMSSLGTEKIADIDLDSEESPEMDETARTQRQSNELVTLIRALCEAGSPEESLKYFEGFENIGVDAPAEAVEALLWGCAYTKKPDFLFELMRATKEFDVPLSSNQIDALVTCCTNNAYVETGKNVVLKGINDGCPPSEQTWLNLVNASGNLYLVETVHELLELAVENGYQFAETIIGDSHHGILRLKGLSGPTVTCLLWDFLRRVKRDGKIGKPIPYEFEFFCDSPMRHHVRSIVQSVDASLEPEFVRGESSLEAIVYQEQITEWLTKPTGKEEDDELQMSHVPQRLKHNLPEKSIERSVDQYSLRSGNLRSFTHEEDRHQSEARTSATFEQEEFLEWKKKWDIKRAQDRISRKKQRLQEERGLHQQ